MRYTKLGRSGIEVSHICVGGMSFGAPDVKNHEWTIGPEDTEHVIRHAFEQGINYIDTANCYALGTSEEYIGRALRHAGIARDQVVLQSKVYFNEGHLSAEAIRREIDGTLRRLGTDYLDVYMMHRFDYGTPIEETMQALDGLVRAGKVRALGASEMYAYQLHNMQVAAAENGWEPFSVMQCHYNLLYREDEREMIPVCRQYGMALTPYSPLASGHLARKSWDSDSLRSRTDLTMADKYNRAEPLDMPIIDRVAELAARHGVPMAQIAIAWHLCRGVESPTLGFSKPGRVDDAVAAVDLRLAKEEMDWLEEPYLPHELVGPLARPGEKPLAGTIRPVATGGVRGKAKDETRG
ncbi:oxidoreductase, aldo/keto reductase family protein [Bifidobacterium pseudolongum subsp. globosum]|uniref:Oxidoreductase, aldo/keto reductase family protein n=1 Tax=Bifidobacterium pseudolongum subsp. globosum TaxID=1690 RepID=A0A2N3QGX6_9BIFI|nr:aldo/keto reductase [Bifidobacterium pseudolongum]PKU90460.1 oxidoreductase, aldo/keto reductase family protein [Bifidobacterium pseudolongum subsp. globosum]